MSGYLTRLVERSRGLTPHLEPLIAPLHAASEQLTGAGSDPGGLAESFRPPDGPASTKPSAETDATVDADVAGQSAEKTESFVDRREDALASHTELKARPAATIQQPPAPIPSEQVTAISPETKSSRSSVAESAARQSPATVSQPTESRKNEEREMAPANDDITLRASTNRDRAPIIVQPHITGPSERSTVSPVLGGPASASREPPAIHVTIGRVEVRAVTGPTSPARPVVAPAPQKISLEEYLEQRQRRKS